MVRVLLFLALFIQSTIIVTAQNWMSYTSENDGLADNDVRAMVIDPSGNKWFATAEGLSRYNGSEWQTFTTAENILSNDIRDLALEQTGDQLNLWLATDAGVSVMEISGDGATVAGSYTEAGSPLISNDVTAIMADKFGMKWFGTSEGISSFDGTNWRTYVAADSFFIYNDNITSVFSLQNAAPSLSKNSAGEYGLKKTNDYDVNQLLYFGTKGGGATRLIVQGVDAVTTGSPVATDWGHLLSDNIYSVFVDLQGDSWFGTDNGVSHYSGTDIRSREDWVSYTTDSVYTTYKVFKYNVWYDQDTVYTINGDGLADLVVQAICADNEGGLWFGTKGGLTRYNGAAWYSFTNDDGLVNNNVSDLVCDADGSLWISTSGGVSHLVQTVVAAEPDPLPSRYKLSLTNYPNPFNLQTTISFTIIEKGDIRLRIFNVLGQLVYAHDAFDLNPGKYEVEWNGRNKFNQDVPSGIYLVHLTAGSHAASHKMMIVK